MVRLVENQHRTRTERREEVAEPAHVGFVGQNAVGDDEARADAPRIGRKSPRPAGLQKVLAVDDSEVEAKFLRQFVLPLQQHRGRRGDENHVDTTPQKQLANDKAGLDSFTKADVVGDQQIHAWQFQSLGQRKKLIGVQSDAGPKRCLEQLPVRRGCRAPFGRA